MRPNLRGAGDALIHINRKAHAKRFRHALEACEPYSPPILLLDPSSAHAFVERGFTQKQQLIDWLGANAVVTAREYWDDPWVQTLITPLDVTVEGT